jgi:hypothetical protein
VIAEPGQLTLRWDVAMDMNAVGYAAYYQDRPFDFAADPALRGATRVEVAPRVPASYPAGVGPSTFASEATLVGLVPGRTYHVLLRAFDRAASRHEDQNRVTMTGVPTP